MKYLHTVDTSTEDNFGPAEIKRIESIAEEDFSTNRAWQIPRYPDKAENINEMSEISFDM